MDESGPCLAVEPLCQTPTDNASQRKRPCSPWVSQLSTQAINRVRSQVLNGRSSLSNLSGIEHDEMSTYPRHVDVTPSSPPASFTAELSNRVNELSAAMRLQVQRLDIMDTELRHWRSQRQTDIRHQKDEMQLQEEYERRIQSLEILVNSQSAPSDGDHTHQNTPRRDSLILTELRVRLDALELRSAEAAQESSTPDKSSDHHLMQLAFRADQTEGKIQFLEQSMSRLNEAIVEMQRSSTTSQSLHNFAPREQFLHLVEATRVLEERVVKAEATMPTLRSAGDTALFGKRLGKVEEWIAVANKSNLIEVGMPMIMQCDEKLAALENVFEDIVQKLERSLQLAAAPASQAAEHQERMLDLEMRFGNLAQEIGNLREICVGTGESAGPVKLSTIAETAPVESDHPSTGISSQNETQYCSLFDSLVKEPDGVMPRLASHDRRINGISEICRKQESRSEDIEARLLEKLAGVEAELQSIVARDSRRADEISQLASWTSSPILDDGKQGGSVDLQSAVANAVPLDLYARDMDEIVNTLAKTDERLHLMESQVTRFVESAFSFTAANQIQKDYDEDSIDKRLKHLEVELSQMIGSSKSAPSPNEVKVQCEEVKQELQMQLSLKDEKVERLTTTVSEGICELKAVAPMVMHIRDELQMLSSKESCVDALTSTISSGISELRSALVAVSSNGSPLTQQIQTLRGELLQHQAYLDTSGSNTAAIITKLKTALDAAEDIEM